MKMSARMPGTVTADVIRRTARFDAFAIARCSDRDARDLRARALHGVGDRRRGGADEAEAALARLVALDGGVEIGRVEGGPQHVGEIELRVREAVEEKIRDAPF